MYTSDKWQQVAGMFIGGGEPKGIPGELVKLDTGSDVIYKLPDVNLCK